MILRALLPALLLLAACSQAPQPQSAALSIDLQEPKPAQPAPATPQAQTPAPSFTVATPLSLDAELNYGDYAWNADGVAAGPLTVVVDLLWQRIYAYRAGVEIGRASIIYGADNKPTPLGTFPILEKDKDHVSNLYDAPMPYMLRLTMDGISIHASTVEYASATNGCVGVPEEFAALLFGQAKIGDKVLVTKGWAREVYGRKAQVQT